MFRLLSVHRACAMVTVSAAMAIATSSGAQKGVVVKADEAAHRVDVTIDGTPFTSYLWDTNQRKPVLYPLIAPDGTTVTRGYPFAMRPGERVDHPHHAGLWFNYGNANGFDFWNNSDAIPVAQRPKYGTITHDHIVSVKSGKDAGELIVESTWTTGAGDKILVQTTRYVFRRTTVGGAPARGVDLTMTLKALSPVVFHDDKEGCSDCGWRTFWSRRQKKAACLWMRKAIRRRWQRPIRREQQASTAPARARPATQRGAPAGRGAF